MARRKVGIDADSGDVLSGNARIETPKSDQPTSRRARVVTTNKNYAKGGAVRGGGCEKRGNKFKGRV